MAHANPAQEANPLVGANKEVHATRVQGDERP